MDRKRKFLLLLIVIGLLFVLTSCGDIEAPIATGSIKWYEWVLVIPIGWLMQFFAGLFNNSYAMGIILTTLVIRTLAWPIYAKTTDLSLKMAIMQPELQKIQAKYADRKDQESQQRMQMEMSQLYKKHNFNPLGCFMPFLQMPIFISVYQVVRRIWIPGGIWADKVSKMTFLGIDLSKAGNLGAIFGKGGDWKGWILATIVLGTNVILNYIASKKPAYQKQTHTHSSEAKPEQTQQTMKVMQYFMIGMMFVFALTSNSIALYWIIGNSYSIMQTLINRKLNEKKYLDMKYDDLVVKSRDK